MSEPVVETRIVPGFPAYKVGTDGSVWSRRRRGPCKTLADTWHQLKACPSGPYLVLILCEGGLQKMFRVNVLVLLAFVGPCPDGMECCHNDGDSRNNRLDNLRWDTHVANQQDAARQGKTARGIRQGSHKLTEDDVRKIRSLYQPRRYSVHRLAREFNVTANAIHRIVRRTAWAHV